VSRAFDRIAAGLREAVAVARGEIEPARIHHFGPHGADKKMGGRAEAPRPSGFPMLDLTERRSRAPDVSRRDHKITAHDLVREGMVKWTSVEASIVLNECRYEKQDRDLTAQGRDHVQVLADIMRRDKWRRGEALDFAKLGSKLVLLNGHHRLTAQSFAGVTVEWSIVIHSVRDDDEVSALFYSFDTNVRKRSAGTILDAYNMSELLGVSKVSAKALFNAAPLLMTNFDFARISEDVISNRVIDRRVELMKAYQKECQLLDAAIDGARSKLKQRLTTAGAFAVALTTFRYQKDRAVPFWHGVAENDGLIKGDPRHAYISTVTDATTKGTLESTARVAASAWNAFYDGRTIGYLKPTRAGFRIAGTPVGR